MQINAARSPAVMDDLRVRVFENHIDILCVQEPPITNKDRLLGAPGTQVVLSGRSESDPTERPGAAIIVVEPELTTTAIGQLCSRNCACVLVEGKGGAFYVVSLYCRYGEAMEGYVEAIQCCQDELRGSEVLYCMDANGMTHY